MMNKIKRSLSVMVINLASITASNAFCINYSVENKNNVGQLIAQVWGENIYGKRAHIGKLAIGDAKLTFEGPVIPMNGKNYITKCNPNYGKDNRLWVEFKFGKVKHGKKMRYREVSKRLGYGKERNTKLIQFKSDGYIEIYPRSDHKLEVVVYSPDRKNSNTYFVYFE